MIGVAIMVESFRESLRQSLKQTMRADVYVSAPGSPEAPTPLDRKVIAALLALPAVRAQRDAPRRGESPSGHWISMRCGSLRELRGLSFHPG